MVESKPARRGGHVPQPSLRLRVVGVAPSRSCRQPHSLRTTRSPRGRSGAAFRPLRRPGGPALLDPRVVVGLRLALSASGPDGKQSPASYDPFELVLTPFF